MDAMRQKTFAIFSLFTSFGTLICCALPALLVALGAGAVLAGLVAHVPQLIWLSEHKTALFAVAGAILALVGLVRYATRNAPCPVDPAMAKACAQAPKRAA